MVSLKSTHCRQIDISQLRSSGTVTESTSASPSKSDLYEMRRYSDISPKTSKNKESTKPMGVKLSLKSKKRIEGKKGSVGSTKLGKIYS